MSAGRPKRPLDRAAVKAANEKLWAEFPELKGRQLTAEDSDYKYRQFWNEAYGGEVDKKRCPKDTVISAAVTGCSEKPPSVPLIKAEWQKKALAAAKIDEKDWIPDKGFEHNRETVKKVYAYYAGLYNSDQNLLWAGMAKLAGGTVYGGLETGLNVKTGAAIGAVALPFPMNAAAVVAHRQAQYVENKMVQMQKNIFSDLAWQHQAYTEGGICELEAAAQRGEMSQKNVQAWRDIASGDPARVQKGNKALLRQEQFEVLDDSYQKLRGGPLGGARAAMLSRLADSPIPGGKPFGEVVPGSDVTNFPDRWQWIETDMLPKYQALTPADRMSLVNQPLEDLAARNFEAGSATPRP